MIHPLHVAVELWVGSRVWLQQWMDMDWKHTLFQGISRIVVTIIAVYIAIVFPGFDRVMVRHPFTCAWYTYIHHDEYGIVFTWCFIQFWHFCHIPPGLLSTTVW